MALRHLFHGWHNFMLIPNALRWLYASVVLRQMVDALLLIIVPVYLYQQAENLPFLTQLFPDVLQAGLASVILYFWLGRFFHLVLAQPMSWVMTRFSLKTILILGELSKLASFLALASIPHFPAGYFLAALLWAPILSWYWNAYHLYLASGMDPEILGKEMGTHDILLKLAAVTAPLLSVLMVPELGFLGVYLLAALGSFGSMMFLLWLPSFQLKTRWHWKDFFSWIKKKKQHAEILGLAGWFWENHGLNHLWPLFLFLFFGNLMAVGYLFTGATFLSLLFIYLAGSVFDRHRNLMFARSSGSLLALLWLPRLLIPQFPLLPVFVEALDRIVGGAYLTFFSATLIFRSRQNNPVIFFHNRQVLFDVIQIVGGLLLLLLLLLGWSWSIVFLSMLAAGFLSLLFLRRAVK